MKYLLQFSQQHESFWLPELDSLLELNGISPGAVYDHDAAWAIVSKGHKVLLLLLYVHNQTVPRAKTCKWLPSVHPGTGTSAQQYSSRSVTPGSLVPSRDMQRAGRSQVSPEAVNKEHVGGEIFRSRGHSFTASFASNFAASSDYVPGTYAVSSLPPLSELLCMLHLALRATLAVI